MRRIITALAVASLALGAASTAHAESASCKDLQKEVRSLQAELRHAPPNAKAGLIALIDKFEADIRTGHCTF